VVDFQVIPMEIKLILKVEKLISFKPNTAIFLLSFLVYITAQWFPLAIIHQMEFIKKRAEVSNNNYAISLVVLKHTF